LDHSHIPPLPVAHFEIPRHRSFSQGIFPRQEKAGGAMEYFQTMTGAPFSCSGGFGTITLLIMLNI
jgi:hypothetical protein